MKISKDSSSYLTPINPASQAVSYTRRIVASILLTVAVMLAVETNASATIRYWVVDITELGFDPVLGPARTGFPGYGSMSINNWGEVVYGVDVSGDIHPWVWLPDAHYGFSQGFHDLYDAEDAEGEHDPLHITGIARDINESGVIVGQAGEGIYYTHTDSACTWELAGGYADFASLGTLGTAFFDWSGAEAINNDDPPVIVGQATRMGVCMNGCTTTGDEVAVEAGFHIELGDTLSGGDLLNGSRYNSAVVTGVSSSALTTTPLLAGISNCHFACFDNFEPSACIDAGKEATRWATSSGVIMSVITSNSILAGSSARGMSDSGHVAGWSVNGVGEDPDCKRIAGYWPLPNGTRKDLNAHMPDGQEDDDSWAEGVNSWTYPMVVGWNASFDLGILWEQLDGSTWTGTDLNEIVGCTDRWEIKFAHDVNDSGWIAAVAIDKDDDNAFHAVVLVPLPECPADVTQNGCVDVDDLLAVNNAWGDCDPGVICWADITANCTVDVDDLLQVTTEHWCNDTDPPCCQNCGESFGPPFNLEDVIHAIVEGPIPYEDQDEVIVILIERFGS